MKETCQLPFHVERTHFIYLQTLPKVSGDTSTYLLAPVVECPEHLQCCVAGEGCALVLIAAIDLQNRSSYSKPHDHIPEDAVAAAAFKIQIC